jgi:hypothetical protein
MKPASECQCRLGATHEVSRSAHYIYSIHLYRTTQEPVFTSRQKSLHNSIANYYTASFSTRSSWCARLNARSFVGNYLLMCLDAYYLRLAHTIFTVHAATQYYFDRITKAAALKKWPFRFSYLIITFGIFPVTCIQNQLRYFAPMPPQDADPGFDDRGF